MEEGHPPPAAGVPHLRMSPLQRHAPNTNPTPPSRFREAGLPRRRTQSMYQASSPHISPRPSPATKRVVQQLRTTGNHSSSPKQRLFRSGSRTSMFSVDSEGLETGSSSSGGGGPPLHSTPSLSNLLESRSFCVTPEFTETRTRLHRTMSTQSLVRDDFFPGFSSPVSMRADTPQSHVSSSSSVLGLRLQRAPLHSRGDEEDQFSVGTPRSPGTPSSLVQVAGSEYFKSPWQPLLPKKPFRIVESPRSAPQRTPRDEVKQPPSGSLSVQMAFKVVRWYAKARLKVKQQRHRAARQRVMELIESGDVIVEVDPQEEVPWWQQGNLEMYTEENLERRDSLRKNAGILEAAEEFWNLVGKVHDNHDLCPKSEYIALSMQINALLIPESTEEEHRKTAEEDWQEDAANKWASTIDHDRFIAGIFDIADVWCATVQPQEYVDFLYSLLDFLDPFSTIRNSGLGLAPELNTKPLSLKSGNASRQQTAEVKKSSTPQRQSSSHSKPGRPSSAKASSSRASANRRDSHPRVPSVDIHKRDHKEELSTTTPPPPQPGPPPSENHLPGDDGESPHVALSISQLDHQGGSSHGGGAEQAVAGVPQKGTRSRRGRKFKAKKAGRKPSRSPQEAWPDTGEPYQLERVILQRYLHNLGTKEAPFSVTARPLSASRSASSSRPSSAARLSMPFTLPPSPRGEDPMHGANRYRRHSSSASTPFSALAIEAERKKRRSYVDLSRRASLQTPPSASYRHSRLGVAHLRSAMLGSTLGESLTERYPLLMGGDSSSSSSSPSPSPSPPRHRPGSGKSFRNKTAGITREKSLERCLQVSQSSRPGYVKSTPLDPSLFSMMENGRIPQQHVQSIDARTSVEMEKLLQELCVRSVQRQNWATLHSFREDLEEEFSKVTSTFFLTDLGDEEEDEEGGYEYL